MSISIFYRGGLGRAADYSTALLQTRTSAIKAHGSSDYGFAGMEKRVSPRFHDFVEQNVSSQSFDVFNKILQIRFNDTPYYFVFDVGERLLKYWQKEEKGQSKVS